MDGTSASMATKLMNDRNPRPPRTLRLELPADPRPRVDIGPPFRRFNGGWLALDFVNTVPGWIPHPQDRDGWQDLPNGERLLEYADLVQWSRLQDVVSDRVATSLERASRKRPKRARSVIRRARALRAVLYRLFRASALGWSPRADDLELLNAELARLRRREVVAPGESGLEVVWLGEEADLEGLLWPPLRSAVSLLTTPQLSDRLGQCGGPGCGWMFVDTGPGRPRRWCDSRDCGNVVKARAFRERQREDTGTERTGGGE
jgi:predicted RNA-binding Zn ribbon-like protein